MSTTVPMPVQPASAVPNAAAAFVDRWIFVFMAALFVVAALVGFVPVSVMKVAAVEAGQRPPFPPVLHLHAVLMGSWLMLLLTQSTLMATGRASHHRRLGMAALALAPAIVVTGVVLVPTMYAQAWQSYQAAAPEQAAAAAGRLEFAANILLFQMRAGVLFSVLVWLAFRARKDDVGLHKRLMVLTTLVPMPAALGRMFWLPTTLPASPWALELYPLVLLLPMFLWDLHRQRRVHRAYLVYLVLNAPFVVVGSVLWGHPWWQRVVPAMMGLG